MEEEVRSHRIDSFKASMMRRLRKWANKFSISELIISLISYYNILTLLKFIEVSTSCHQQKLKTQIYIFDVDKQLNYQDKVIYLPLERRRPCA